MTEGTGFWFARRFPVGNPRNAMVPVTAEGMQAVWRFVGTMTAGAIFACVLAVLAVFTHWSLYVASAFVFVAAAIYGGWTFISIAMRKGDSRHTAADYRAGIVPGQKPFGS